MSDNGWTRLIEDRSVRRECAGTDDATWQPDRISQADSFRDLALGIAGMLTLAAIANLFILSL
jgi:hypothetical protein